MPEGESTVLDNSCLLFLSNMWSGTKHYNKKVPVVTIGGLGGKLNTGRALDYFESGDDNRKLCSLYLGIMDRVGVELAEFGDAKNPVNRFLRNVFKRLSVALRGVQVRREVLERSYSCVTCRRITRAKNKK